MSDFEREVTEFMTEARKFMQEMREFKIEVREFKKEIGEFRQEFREEQVKTTRYRKGATLARHQTNLRLIGIENRLSLLESEGADPHNEYHLEPA